VVAIPAVGQSPAGNNHVPRAVFGLRVIDDCGDRHCRSTL